jgi:hypothetical protein
MIWWTPAFAADLKGFDAHGFTFASAEGDLRAPTQFVRPGDVDGPSWALGAVAEYASRPLLFEADGVRTVALEDLVAVDLAGSFAPVDRLRIDVSAPVFLTSAAEGVAAGPTLGDLRVSALFAGLRPEDSGGFGLGLVAALDAPTGDPQRYLGTTGPAGLLAISSTVEVDRYTFSWMAGGRLAPNTRPQDRPAPTRGGDTIEAAGALSALVADRVGVGIEARASIPVDPLVRAAIGLPATALLTARYGADGTSWVSAGVGTGLGLGAGASPFRAVLGGGFGGRPEEAPRDRDQDGIVDPSDACPGDAEAVNGYRDQDGCPDQLPELQFVVRRGDAPDASVPVTATGMDGGERTGVGELVLAGLPGQTWTATARAESCLGASATAPIPDEGRKTVTLDLARVDAALDITVTDTAGRPLEGVEARYLVDDDRCAPVDTSLRLGRGVHHLGAGPVMVFLTAPGYGVFQTSLTLAPGETRALEARLEPTQVRLEGGRFESTRPLQFSTGAAIAGSSEELLGQMASIMLSTDARFEVLAWAPAGGTTALSQQRADAVVDYLVSVGVPRDRISAVGKGPLPRGQKDVVEVEVAQ